ncbi:hypothetical protein [Thalassotalea crassostreae]|uniref:hypothetical protein n=1 Tax=Thalassotalea crassostreae TaxID=1763536 RepID=UPI0008386E3B|nr:hypothetical protein [Thalassotalea crassostreae]
MNIKILPHLIIASSFILTTACTESAVDKSAIDNNAIDTIKTSQTDAGAYADAKAKRLAAVEQNVEQQMAKLTLDEKISLIHASGKFHVNAIERLGLPELWLSDGPLGVR